MYSSKRSFSPVSTHWDRNWGGVLGMPQASGSRGCGRLVWFQTRCSILWSGFKLWIGSDRVVCLDISSLGLHWQEHLAVDIKVSMPAWHQQERLSSLGDTTTLGPEWLQRGHGEVLEFVLVPREVWVVGHSENMMGSMKLRMFQTTISGVPTLRGFIQRFGSALLLSVNVSPFCPQIHTFFDSLVCLEPLHLQEFGLVPPQQFSWQGSGMICPNRDWNDDGWDNLWVAKARSRENPESGMELPLLRQPTGLNLGIVNLNSKNAWNWSLVFFLNFIFF